MIDYQNLIQNALLGVVRDILKQVEENGLNGDNYFYITFQTNTNGVIIPSFLKEKYPTEMTIVLQHQFENLSVSQNGFSVDLSFQGKPQTISIPFKSILVFADPSVNFSLQFTPALLNEHTEQTIPETPLQAEIISLDALRNKK